MNHWGNTVELLLSKPRSDLLIWDEDIYMCKQARSMRRAVLEAENLLEQIDPKQSHPLALKEAKEIIGQRLLYYQYLPGNNGEWECSVILEIKDHLEKLINQK